MENLNHNQLAALAKAIEQIDANKIEFFQAVNLSDDDANTIRTISPGIAQLTSLGIQVSPIALDAVKEYKTDLYFEEHENDPIEELGIDLETYSSEDLTETGVYKYVEAEDFQILLFAYSVNNSPVRIIDLAIGETLPPKILNALRDPNVLKTAYNAAFERICLSKYLGLPLGTYLSPDDWDCTMVRAARLALPLSLAQCGAVLGLGEQKMKEGKSLINYFSKPCRPTKANGMRTRNLPEHAPEKWATFKRYCVRDVEVEQAIRRKVTRLQVTPTERKIWLLDQRINDRGVQIDLQMAKKASDFDDEYREKLSEEARNLTGLENPNSVTQLKAWLKRETGIDFPSVTKETVAQALPRINSQKAKRMLQIRQELGKTSTAKYKAMLTCACADGRARGLFQFYGANRTGRFAGRLLQLQNLPQNHIADIDYARNLVKQGTLEDIEFEFGNVPKLLSELIRTAFIAKEGCTFHVCDFSAIEARVIAWLAGENWVLDVFRSGGDIYCATASQMFGVPVEKHGQNAELRQRGKVSVLALGYGGGIEALRQMGGERLGLTDDEMYDTVKKWRKANPHIVRLWKHVEAAVRAALTGDALPIEKGLKFETKWGGLSITLPSKRQLFYPRMHLNPQTDRLEYEGMNQEKKIWCTLETYGGKLTENIVQAIARDALVETMLRLDEEGINIVFHIHDETVNEARPEQTLEQIEEIFGREIPWAKGLPLKGAGYTTPYYLKD